MIIVWYETIYLSNFGGPSEVNLPLSVVGIGVSSVVSSVAVVESRVSVGVGTISVGGVEEGGISLGLGLGLSISRSREKRE